MRTNFPFPLRGSPPPAEDRPVVVDPCDVPGWMPKHTLLFFVPPFALFGLGLAIATAGADSVASDVFRMVKLALLAAVVAMIARSGTKRS